MKHKVQQAESDAISGAYRMPISPKDLQDLLDEVEVPEPARKSSPAGAKESKSARPPMTKQAGAFGIFARSKGLRT